MKILKNIKMAGHSDGVIIEDGSTQYPIFLESLLVPVIMDELLASGYQYCGMPYDFRLNGRKLSELPTEEVTYDDATIQAMYDMLGTPYTPAELSAKVVLADDAYKSWEPGEYQIFTRKEFEEYLDRSIACKSMDDFRPINYFVHPDALYTVDEWLSGEHSKYMHIIESRRHMPYLKFQNLLKWCVERGMDPDAKALDIVKFLFRWGIDGINMPMLRMEELASNKPLGKPSSSVRDTSALTEEAIYNCIKTHALIDKTGAIQVEERYNFKNPWKPYCKKQAELMQEVSLLQGNEKVYHTVYQISRDMHVKVYGKNIEAAFSAEVLMIGDYQTYTYMIDSPASVPASVSKFLWPLNRKDEVFAEARLLTLADKLIKKRIVECDASTIKALLSVGLSPYSAGVYWLYRADLKEKAGGGKANPLENKTQEIPPISPVHIQAYLTGAPIEDDVIYDTIDNFYKGVSNIDGVLAGERKDESYNSSDIFKRLYCAHYIMGYSLDELDTLINNVTDQDTALVLEKNDIKLSIALPYLNYKQQGFETDRYRYKTWQTTQASEYLYITSVAKEFGSAEATRHVAADMWCIGKAKAETMLLNELEAEILQRIEKYAQPSRIDQWKLTSKKSAALHFFEAALNGYYTFPDELGGETITVTPEQQKVYHSFLRPQVESLTAICDSAVDCEGNFVRYCVNATIYPDKVVPLKNCYIHETSMTAVWSVKPDKLPVLRDRMLIIDDKTSNTVGMYPSSLFSFWESRCIQESRLSHEGAPLSLDNMYAPTTLYYYARQAQEYQNSLPDNVPFISVPHPTEYLWPKWYAPEKLDEDLADKETDLQAPALRQGKPTFIAGNGTYIAQDDVIGAVADLFDIAVNADKAIEMQEHIKEFRGFTAHDFACSDVLADIELPPKGLTITPVSTTAFFTEDNIEPRNYTELENLSDKYAIKMIADRHYVFSDATHALWEVTI